MVCWFLAVGVLSLGSATAIGFAAPLFTTLLSIVILKEKVGVHRWSALLIGFVGVLIIAHPGAGTLTFGALFALGNAILISTVAIAIRRMSMSESAETLTLYQMSIMTVCTACLITLGFHAPHWGDVLMIALAGVGNGVAQFWWTRSLSLAPPSAVVPFNYLSLVWATVLGFVVWGDVPTPDLLVGSAIVASRRDWGVHLRVAKEPLLSLPVPILADPMIFPTGPEIVGKAAAHPSGNAVAAQERAPRRRCVKVCFSSIGMSGGADRESRISARCRPTVRTVGRSE
jgi:uncharacterized membrane protein